MLQPPPMSQNTYLLGTSQELLPCKLFPRKLLALISMYLPVHSGDAFSLTAFHCMPLCSHSFSAYTHLSEQQAADATEDSSQKLLTWCLPLFQHSLGLY